MLASGTRVYETSGAAHTAPSTISSYGLGTKVCYALSVRPYDQSTGDWRHSALACYVIGKKPKVGALNGGVTHFGWLSLNDVLHFETSSHDEAINLTDNSREVRTAFSLIPSLKCACS